MIRARHLVVTGRPDDLLSPVDIGVGLLLTFPQPADALTLNDRQHWHPKSEATRAWRNAAAMHAVLAFKGASKAQRSMPPGLVTVTLDVRGNRRRDPHNYHATVKPLVDGLVHAGIWPDDTPEYVTTAEPVLRVVPGKRRNEPAPLLMCTVSVQCTLNPRKDPTP